MKVALPLRYLAANALCRRSVLVSCTLVKVSLGAVQAAGQVYVGADAAYSNRYVWRGITRTSHQVLQPDVFLSIGIGESFVTLGAWTSVELVRSDARQLSDTGVDEWGIGEFNYWLEYHRGFGPLDAAIGWTEYLFDNDAVDGGRTRDFNTGELYGRIELLTVPVSPRLAVWYDVDNVDGAYFESSVDLRIPILPVASLFVTGLAGWSAGQKLNQAGDPESGHFADDGLTHVDFSAWTSILVAGGWSIAPALHVQFNRDALTERTKAEPPDSDQSSKIWFSVVVSWFRGFGGEP